jgi:putative ABC transport system permease protein
MPDFRRLVRGRVAPLSLAPEAEDKVVAEWAAQLEEVYAALRADGLSEVEALRELERQLPDAREIGADLVDREPVVVRLAAPPRTTVAARALRAWATVREMLTVGVLRDLRAGVRLLVKEPGFSATVIMTLAVCLGANAAIFTVVNAVLLRPLPIPESGRIVGMGDVYPTITPNDVLASDVPSYFDRREALTALDEQAMFTFWYDALAVDGVPQELRGMRVTPSLFRLLRVPPLLGRTFTDEEGETGDGRSIVLSYGLWQTLYGGDPAVLGQSLRMGWTGDRYTIIGVMPREFSFFDQGYDGHATEDAGVQFWLPLIFTPQQKSDNARSRYGFFHIGRLQPGATVQQVREQLNALHAVNVRRFPQFRFAELGMYPSVLPLQEALTRGFRRTLYLLWAGAGFVLLIGAINIANLSLARASARRRELATRLALGAGRLQMMRQLMIEALIPAFLGAVGGGLVGAGILRGLAFAGLENLPSAGSVRIDATTVAFIALIAVAVALLIGLLPAMATRAVTVNQVLGDGSRSGTAGRSARLFRRGLVVTQVALSVILLIVGTLLLASFRHLLNVDAGFTATGVVTATVFPPPSRYPDDAAVASVLNRIRDRVRIIPGVESVGMTSNIALSGFESPSPVSATDRSGTNDPPLVPSVVAVTPGYFEAMSTLLMRGRYFDDSDRDDTGRVAILDEHLAGRLWPGEDPLGKAINRGESGPYTVVGVVRDVRFESLGGSIDRIGTAYFPQTQAPPMRRVRWMAIKSIGEPAAIVRAARAAVAEVDPDLPIADIQTMTERTARSLVSERLATTLAATFAVIALFLSMLGIYGVLANVVARRTREIGIRMALGSTVGEIFRLVLKEGAALITGGLLLGLAGAVAMAEVMKGLLFGVQPTDPLLLGSVAVGTGCIALLACLAPANRAARVDPVEVLSEP